MSDVLDQEQSEAQNQFANQKIRKTNVVGTSPGGDAKNVQTGNFVTEMLVYEGATGSTNNALPYLKFTFDDGTVTTLGVPSGGLNTKTINLGYDTVMRMALLVGGSDNDLPGGVVGIYVEMLKAGTYSWAPNGSSPLTDGGWTYIIDNQNTDGDVLRNFVITGIDAHSGTNVDKLGFYYKTDQMVQQGITDLAFNAPSLGTVSSANVATATVSNTTSETQRAMISFSESVSSSYTFSTTAGVSMGIKTTVQAGMPFVANGEVEYSATASLDITMGASKSVSRTFNYRAFVDVDPQKQVTATAMATETPLSMTYSAKLSEVWVHAGAVTRRVTGNLNAVSAYDVVVNYTEIDLPST